jgi:uncharacterized sporulation protein YeaH/YhbH (DUF444 family)
VHIIDRRPNPSGKSLANRRRLLRRTRAVLQRAAREAVKDGRIGVIGKDETVEIPADVLHEPSFHTVFTGGARSVVLNGNTRFSTGDQLPRPPGGGSGQGGGAGRRAGRGSGEDAFRFVLTRDEFLELFFEDLELPDLVKRQIVDTEVATPVRSGLSMDGAPPSLDLSRTMRRSMARRIGLQRPKPAWLAELETEIAALEASGDDPERLRLLLDEAATVRRRLTLIPWIDPVDLRYRRFTPTRRPSARAVMFCLMDVSGSMTEGMKDLAKRFFLLLHVFLERRYQRVEIVFIRHTDSAEEVDEQTFFTDPRTGGTIISTALAELVRIQRARYPADSWNIYVAQASDGDNYANDTPRVAAILEPEILPLVQYFAYIEVGAGPLFGSESETWRSYMGIAQRHPQLVLRRVRERREIFPVFRELFAKRPAAA